MKKFQSFIGAIDNPEKYHRIKSFLNLAELHNQVKTDFLDSAFEQCDEERKFLLWIDGYTEKKNISYITKFLIKENLKSYSSNSFKHILKQLKDPEEQSLVLNAFLSTLGIIDNPDKYHRITSLLGLAEIDKEVKATFLTSIVEHCDEERKYLLWLKGYIQEKDLSYISGKLAVEEVDSYSNPFELVFKRLEYANEQTQVLNAFLPIICPIDNPGKYRRIKFLLEVSGTSDQLRADFLDSVFEKCDEERKFLLWIDGYTEKKNISYIIQELAVVDVELDSDFYEELFIKLEEDKDQTEVLKGFLSEIGIIDNPKKYNRLTQLVDSAELHNQVKIDFLGSAFEQCDEERKLLLWIDGYTEKKNISYITDKLKERNTDSCLFRKIFKKIGEGKDIEAILNGFLSKIGSIDDYEKYCKVVSLLDLNKFDEECKANFIDASFKLCNEENEANLFLEYFWQHSFPNNNETLRYLLEKIDTSRFFGFCTQLVEPLSQINTHHYHHGLSFLKIFLK